MNWDTFFLGIIACSSLLLVLATVMVAVGIFRTMTQFKASMAVVEKEAVKALREVQGTAKGVTDFSSTAKRLTEETFLMCMARRMGRPSGGQGPKAGGLGTRDVMMAGLGMGFRILRSVLSRRKSKATTTENPEAE